MLAAVLLITETGYVLWISDGLEAKQTFCEKIGYRLELMLDAGELYNSVEVCVGSS